MVSTTYAAFTPVELWDLGKQCCVGSTLWNSYWPGWVEGAKTIMCSPAKVGKLAFITIQPSLWQRLQISCHLAQGQENHTLMEWITATMWTVWNDARELPDNASKWQTC